MSWETLVTGHIAFKEGTPENLKQNIIEELEEAFEAELRWDGEWKKYTVEDVNWTSHVTEDKIQRVYEKWKPFFKMFSVSLYYLNEPDYDEYLESDDQDANGILVTLIDEIIDEIEYSVGYHDKLRTLIDFLKVAEVDRELLTRKILELTEALQDAEIELDKDCLMDLITVLEKKAPAAVNRFKRSVLTAVL